MMSSHCANKLSLLLCYILISTILNTIYATNIATTIDDEYKNQIINCTLNEPCYILCQNTDSCLSSTINCAPDYPCEVTCTATGACESAIIHAESSSIFKLLNCNDGQWTCIGMTLYLPPNSHGEKRAFLLGADRGFSAGNSNAKPLQFYAIYGWNDVNITVDASRFTFANQVGTMHCTIHYNITCAFKSDAWTCANINDICNNPPTSSPTINPTIFPTIYPTTNPTFFPTYYPTKYPTYYPSIYPTINPTTILPTTSFPTTSIPTTAPPTTSLPTTNIPTNNPITSAPTYDGQTFNPTLSPTSIPTISQPTTSPINNTKFPSTSPTITITESVSDGDLLSTKKSGLDPLLFLIIGLALLLVCFLTLLFWFCRRTRRVQQELNHKFSETQTEVQNLKRESVHTMSRKETTTNQYVITTDSPAPVKLKTTTLQNSPDTRTGSTHSATNSTSSSNATIELIDEINEGYINEITNNISNRNTSNMVIELATLQTQTRSIPSSAFSPTSALSALSGIPSTVPVSTTLATTDRRKELTMVSDLDLNDVDSPFPDKDRVEIVRHRHHLHMPQKSTQHSLDLCNLNRPVTAPAPPWFLQPDVDVPTHGLSNDAWEEQLNSLRQQWMTLQSSRPGSANFAAMVGSLPAKKNKRSFFEDHADPDSIYANMPMSAPVMDHTVFFNTMLHKYNAVNPQTATAMMQQHKLGTSVSVQPPTLTNIPTNKSLAPPNNEDDVASNLSSNLSYLSGVPMHMQGVSGPTILKPQDTTGDLSVIWNETEKSELTCTATQTHDDDIYAGDQPSDTASNCSSPSHTDTMSAVYTLPNIPNLPSVLTTGNKTEHTEYDVSEVSDSDISEYSTSVTMTMSVGSQSQQIVDLNAVNKIKGHFRIPSVITDGHLSDEEDEDMDLPSLIQIDEDIQQVQVQVQDDVKGQFEEQMDMLPEYDEDDESEMTIELQLDDNEATQTLQEETEEYTDSMDEEEDTLLTRETKEDAYDDDDDGLSSHIDSGGDGSRSGAGFEEYGNDSNYNSRSSVSVTATMTQTHSDYSSHNKGGTFVINDDDLMDDDFDDMLNVSNDDIIDSFNDKNYDEDGYDHEDDEYYDTDEYED